MKAIVTVIGEDKVGIIAAISGALARNEINIMDVNQTVMSGSFTMMMLVDMTDSGISFDETRRDLESLGEDMNLSVRIQREEIFLSMHQL